jgi:hypothetical protein
MNKVCKADEIINPRTGKCVKKNGKIGKEILRSSRPVMPPLVLPPSAVSQAGPSRLVLPSISQAARRDLSPNTIKNIPRTGQRKKEFESLFYMGMESRVQYLLDRFLKRLPTGPGVRLNSAMQKRQQHFLQVGGIADEEDEEDLKEAVQRGWISKFDLVNYYTIRNGNEPKPLIRSAEDIVYGTNEVIPKAKSPVKISPRQPRTFGGSIVDEESLKKFFDNLEIAEGKKQSRTAKNIMDQGFADLSGTSGRGKIFSNIRRQLKLEKSRNAKYLGVSSESSKESSSPKSSKKSSPKSSKSSKSSKKSSPRSNWSI